MNIFQIKQTKKFYLYFNLFPRKCQCKKLEATYVIEKKSKINTHSAVINYLKKNGYGYQYGSL